MSEFSEHSVSTGSFTWDRKLLATDHSFSTYGGHSARSLEMLWSFRESAYNRVVSFKPYPESPEIEWRLRVASLPQVCWSLWSYSLGEINMIVIPVCLFVSTMPRCFRARIGQGSHAVVGGLCLDSFTDISSSRHIVSLSTWSGSGLTWPISKSHHIFWDASDHGWHVFSAPPRLRNIL